MDARVDGRDDPIDLRTILAREQDRVAGMFAKHLRHRIRNWCGYPDPSASGSPSAD